MEGIHKSINVLQGVVEIETCAHRARDAEELHHGLCTVEPGADRDTLSVQNGADVNRRDKLGQTPLHWAAQQGHTEIAKALVGKGAFANTLDNAGRAPLYRAVEHNRKAVAEYLISKNGGCDVF